MAKRRGKGEGTITQRADGRWQARVDLGRGPDGRRLRKVAYGATRQAAAKVLNKLLGRAATGELLTTSTPTVKTWLADWFRTHRSEWRPSTQRVYRRAIDGWIVPELGDVRLEKLKPITIQRWINHNTEGGARTKVVLAHVVLHSALGWAMTQRVLTFNPAALVKVPRPARKPITPLSVSDGQRLIEAAQDHPLGGMVILSLTMGLRIGEVSGLAWADVDQAAGTLRLRQQVQVLGKGLLALAPLKTAHSRRTLALPALAAAALKARRKTQLAERLKAGERWKPDGDLVFTSAAGRMLHPSTVRSMFETLLAATKIEHVKYHALRHTAATLLLAAGTPLFDVSRILGHSSIDITSDVYGHLVDDMTASAATRMDGIFKAVGVS